MAFDVRRNKSRDMFGEGLRLGSFRLIPPPSTKYSRTHTTDEPRQLVKRARSWSSMLFLQYNAQVELMATIDLAPEIWSRRLHQASIIKRALLWTGTVDTLKTLRIEKSGPSNLFEVCIAILSLTTLTKPCCSDFQYANTTQWLSDILCGLYPCSERRPELTPSLLHVTYAVSILYSFHVLLELRMLPYSRELTYPLDKYMRRLKARHTDHILNNYEVNKYLLFPPTWTRMWCSHNLRRLTIKLKYLIPVDILPQQVPN